MADEEEKKEDKGEHINLKVKDQVPFSLSRDLSFRARRERERTLCFLFIFFLVVVFLKMKRKKKKKKKKKRRRTFSSNTTDPAHFTTRRAGQRRGALQSEDGHKVQEGASF